MDAVRRLDFLPPGTVTLGFGLTGAAATRHVAVAVSPLQAEDTFDQLTELVEAANTGALLSIRSRGDLRYNREWTLDELFAREFLPFASGVEADVDGIMAAHIVVGAPKEQDTPATLSHELLTGVLRDRLGFDGIIITDSLTMKAVAGFDSPAVQALLAGADMILRPEDAATAKEDR